MESTVQGTLIAVLANPPLTEGKRTRHRVNLAAEILGFRGVEIANLFAFPSRATGAIGEIGVSEEGWAAARPQIEACLSAAIGILLAYGTTGPVGVAGAYFRQQVQWLHERIAESGTRAWQVGDGPRHPSRWQRWTWRAHPDVPFPIALRRSLVPAWLPPFGSSPQGPCEAVRNGGGVAFTSRADSERRGDTCRSAS